MDVSGLIEHLVVRRQDAVPTPTPPGQTPPNRFPQIYGFMGAFMPLATIAVAMRMTSRAKFSYIGKDDIAIVCAYVLFIGLNVATVYAAKYGLGVHIWDVDYPKTGVQMQKCGFTSQVLYPASQGFTKLSILLFFSRVVPSTSKWKKRIWAIATFVVVQETTFTITLFVQCQPTKFYWDKTIPGGRCINQPIFYYVDASINMVTDILILSLPWWIFMSLQVPRRKKYALLAICSVGCFTLITSIIRLPFLAHLNQSKDPTWDVVDIATWSTAELGSAITTSCIPTTRPLISYLFPKFSLTSNHSADESQPGKPSFAMGTVGSARTGARRNYTEITSQGRERRKEMEVLGEGESEEYILGEDGRVIRQVVDGRVIRQVVDVRVKSEEVRGTEGGVGNAV